MMKNAMLFCMAALLLCGRAARAQVLDEASDFRMELALVGSVFPPHVGPGPHNRSVMMDVWCHGDRWASAW